MEPRLLNRAGDEASKGGSRGGNGGWTRRSPSEVWYCGQRRNQCKCGSCDGRCGPANGCPCDDCFVLMEARGAKVNRAGHVAIKGGSRGGHGGWTGRSPSEVWYCGQRKNQCKCGSCDGRCGPANGCPCDDCHDLLHSGDGPGRVDADPPPPRRIVQGSPVQGRVDGNGGEDRYDGVQARLECKVCMPRMCRRSSCPAGTCAYAVLAAVSSVLALCVVPRSSSAFPSTYEVLVVGPRRRVLAAPVRYTLRGGMQRLWSGNL